MRPPSTKRRRRPSGPASTAKPTAPTKTKGTKSKSKSRTRQVSRTPIKERPPFTPVTIESPPDGYFYLELISQDMHAVTAIERELLLRTTLAERCYTQSRIPVYRIPESEASKMDPWPFTQGQTKYAGCSLKANNKEKERYVFRNQFNHHYLLSGDFIALSATPPTDSTALSSKCKSETKKPTNRRTRSRKRA